jgi:hypothetical protein
VRPSEEKVCGLSVFTLAINFSLTQTIECDSHVLSYQRNLTLPSSHLWFDRVFVVGAGLSRLSSLQKNIQNIKRLKGVERL